jgi:predicted P-loop ATPase
MMGDISFSALIGPVARHLLGEPNPRLSSKKQLRFGNHGSVAVEIDGDRAGTFFDNERKVGGGVLDLVEVQTGARNGGRMKWLAENGFIDKSKSKAEPHIVAAYDYCDEASTLLFQVVRLRPKTFRQRRPDGNGGYVWNLKGISPVPYRLPEMLKADPASIVFVAEGEKDVDALRALHFAATCNAGGAEKWRADFAKYLKGRRVVILPDNDEAGERHAAMVERSLTGIAASVALLRLPGLPAKGDVSDWLAAGGTAEDLEALASAALDAPLDDRAPDNIANGAATHATLRTEAAQEDAPEWPQFLQRVDGGEALSNLANAMTALRSADELRNCFAYDEMARETILQKPVPKGSGAGLPRSVTDMDIGQTQEWLQRHELRRLGKDTTHQAVDLRAGERAFHPVRDYLSNLKWDGVPRLRTWLHTYLGVEWSEGTKEYVAGIGTMFLISMVARIFKPGAKVDHMLILEGPQAALKSTAGAILGGRWFSDSLPDIGLDAVRVSQHLRGKWLIEIGELSAMSKAETEELKAYLTRREECYTPKFGRREVTEPRQCVFIGTTNKSVYLRDETGARRFWPVKVGTIDAEALQRDRDHLFAEAVHLFRCGTEWWPSRAFEMKHIQPQQQSRFEDDAWEQAMAEWLSKRASEGDPAKAPVTILNVARGALLIETPKLGTADQRRIAAILERLGWERGPKTEIGVTWRRRQ